MNKNIALAGLFAAFVFTGCEPKKDDAVHADKMGNMGAPAAQENADLQLHPTPEQVAAAKPVGNRICPVSGDSLGAMGAPLQIVYKGKVVGLCCGGCPKTFAKDPDAYLAKAEASVAKP